ncbi:hypothetical protein [Amedibacillus dolichus]|uniref:hypothetical protein n=1 Tax=Amedibacillus dolichus TaxID=31971 RepID=UPI00217522F9|nr:hypothetical protein [Amedibacillus dolichus]
MKMREELLALIEKSDYKGMNVELLSHTLHKEEHALFVEMMKELNALEAEHILARDKRERYFFSKQLGYVVGKLRVNPKGFGFVEYDEGSFYVAPDNCVLLWIKTRFMHEVGQIMTDLVKEKSLRLLSIISIMLSVS